MVRRPWAVLAAVLGCSAGCTVLAGLDAHSQVPGVDASADAADDTALDAPAEAASDAQIDAGSDAPAEAASDAQSDARSDAGPGPNDVLFFTGATVTTGVGGAVVKWDNGNPLYPGLVALPTGTAPSAVPIAGGETCVSFNGEAPLKVDANPAIDFGIDDFSATVVVRREQTLTAADMGRIVISRNVLAPGTPANPQYDYRGFMLLTEYQDEQRITASKALKYAARMLLTTTPSTFEVVDSSQRLDSRDVVMMYRRGDELWLRVNETLKFPPSPKTGASNFSIVGGPFIIGQSDEETDYATRFAGQVCAIIVHRGPELDSELDARIASLRAKYPPK